MEKAELDTLLLLCQRAIEDAVYCEDGLDGAGGEEVLKEIRSYRKKNNLPKTQEPKDRTLR